MSIDDTSAQFSFPRAKTEIRTTLTGARALFAVSAGLAIALTIANGSDLDDEPVVRFVIILLTVLATGMVIAMGALSGHLKMLRGAEHVEIRLAAQIEEVRAEIAAARTEDRELADQRHEDLVRRIETLHVQESHQTQILRTVAAAAGDELGQRRETNGH